MDEVVAPPVPPHDPLAPPAPPTYRDRSGLLLFFGIVEILIGGLCLLLVAASFLVLTAALQTAPGSPQPPALGLWLNVLVYLGAGGFLITMGIGTLRGKKWARAMMLVTSWPFLLAFLLGVLAAAFVAPSLMEAISSTQGKPEIRAAIWVVMAIMSLFFAAIPLSFILFYSGRNVRATFEARDPGPSWVDGRPLPILGFAGAVGLYGLFLLLGLARGAYGFFGVMLTGWAAALVIVAHVLLCVWLAVQIYRMTRAGWWANVAFAVLVHLSGWITLRVIGIHRLMEASGVSADAGQRPVLFDWVARFTEWFMPASMIVWVLTLVWLRRYYPPGTFARPAARVARAGN
ncbi:MAG TPA: hypothetical protein VFD06_08320 [Candidatus Polarisedimenticolia bacterium]|nr:hypothetical protein [Candidatus Polarisedimenticolia bacterium]